MNLRLLYILVGCLLLAACQPSPGPSTPTPMMLPTVTSVQTGPPGLTATAPVAGAATATQRPPTPVVPATKTIEVAVPFDVVLVEDSSLRAKLGQVSGPGAVVDGTQALFEHGTMLWRKDLRQIYVFFDGGKWQSYPDTWEPSQPLVESVLNPPPGLFQPVRGFGKLWLQNMEVREKVGWARGEEQAVSTTWQQFQGGTLVWRGGNSIRALFTDNVWGDFSLPVRPAPRPTPLPAPTQSPTAAVLWAPATIPPAPIELSPTSVPATVAPPEPTGPGPGYPGPAETAPLPSLPTPEGYP